MGIEPLARDCRDRIVVQRRAAAQSALGGTAGDWATSIDSRSAKLNPLSARRGDAEQVIAARLQGTSIWDCWVRWDSQTSQILTTDRVCDARSLAGDGQTYLRTFNIRFAEDMTGRKLWLFLQLEEGVADG